MEKSLIESKHVQKTKPSSNSSSYSRKSMQIALHIGQKAIRQYIEKNCFNLISAFIKRIFYTLKFAHNKKSFLQ